MESWKQKMSDKTSVRSKTAAVAPHNSPLCTRHPTHVQSPGVCSLCLTERLSQLPNSAASAKLTKHRRWPSSSSYSFLSSSSSSCSSPTIQKKKSGGLLKKSRSMAFFTRKKKETKDAVVGEEKVNVEAKRGIWSKLLRRKNNKASSLMHSRTTTKERAAVVAVH